VRLIFGALVLGNLPCGDRWDALGRRTEPWGFSYFRGLNTTESERGSSRIAIFPGDGSVFLIKAALGWM
jgi:hypothetical protein